eukprot:3272553-Alexandrium_andersonii.AAC.1
MGRGLRMTQARWTMALSLPGHPDTVQRAVRMGTMQGRDKGHRRRFGVGPLPPAPFRGIGADSGLRPSLPLPSPRRDVRAGPSAGRQK